MGGPEGTQAPVLNVVAPGNAAMVMVMGFQVVEAKTPAEAAAAIIERFKLAPPAFNPVSQGKATLKDGTPAHEIIYTGTERGYSMKGKILIVLAGGGRAFFVQGNTTQDLYDKQEAQINEVIYSFRLRSGSSSRELPALIAGKLTGLPFVPGATTGIATVIVFRTETGEIAASLSLKESL